ncbi:MAG: MoxR family ATPase, partial [Nanoarchaeota archaeon]|nr:MoxR family ATPase [Nanoarchaeota archaeon]
PEAQSDRFLLKIKVGYPTFEDEKMIVDKYATDKTLPSLRTLIGKQSLLTMQQHTRQVPMANDVRDKVLRIIGATREKKDIIQYGASPRASIGLILAAKARALIQGKNHVSTEDIKHMAYPILRHRIILNFEAERKGMSTDDAVKEIIDKVK